MLYADGSWYEGEWKSDVPDGFGTFTSDHFPHFGPLLIIGVTGERYQGEWSTGVREGRV